MAVKNSTILAKAWLEGTGDYQQRVPSPTVATQKQTMEAIFSPFNGPIYNQFIDTLFTRIGLVYARQQSWRNPLAAFKRGTLAYGGSVQELATAWIRAHTYRDDAQSLLKVHRPEVEQAIHQLNRFDQYPLSVNKVELRQAFTDEYGLNSLVSSIMDVAINSEQYDEYLQMKELIAWYEHTWGFFKIHGDMPEDDTSAKAFLKSLRTMVAKLAFPSTLYNAGIVPDIPVFARPDELVLLISPEASASVDVDTLAALFNLEKAEAQVRQIIVDEFPIPGAYAMLTTEDWFQVYDQTYENGSFYNPQTLTTNYYLTVMQVISCSPFVPAIVWTTEAGTETGTITLTTSNTVNAVQAIRSGCSGCFEAMPEGTKLTKAMVTGKNGDGTPAAIDGVYLFGELQGSLSDGTITGAQEIDGVTVRPDAYVVRDMTFSGSGAPVRNSRTYIDRLGRLHLQAGAYKGNEDLTLTVTIEPTYNNPSGDTPTPVATTVTFTIAAAGGGDDPGYHQGVDFINTVTVGPQSGNSETLQQWQLRDAVPTLSFPDGVALSSVAIAPVATPPEAINSVTVTVDVNNRHETFPAEYAGAAYVATGIDNVLTQMDWTNNMGTVTVTIVAGETSYSDVTFIVTIPETPVPLTGPDFITEVTVTPVAVGATEATISQADLIAGTASASFDATAGGAISAVSFEPVGGDLPAISEARLDLTVGGQLTQLPMYPTVGSDDWTVSGIDSSISAADIAAAGGAISATIVLTAGGTVYSDIHFALSVAAVPVPVNPFSSVLLTGDSSTVASVDMTDTWSVTVESGAVTGIVLNDLPEDASSLTMSYMIGSQERVLYGTASSGGGFISVSGDPIAQYSSTNVGISYTSNGTLYSSGTGAITVTEPPAPASPFNEVLMQIKDGGTDTVDMTVPSWSFNAGAYCVSEVKVYDPEAVYSSMTLEYIDDMSVTQSISGTRDGLYFVFDTESAFQILTVGSKTISGVTIVASTSATTVSSETGSVTVTLS